MNFFSATLHELQVFFNPVEGQSEGIEPLLRRMLFKGQSAVTVRYHHDMRNHLFGNPGITRPVDLLARNIQRGRDHGLPTYNDARVAFGMSVPVDNDAWPLWHDP